MPANKIPVCNEVTIPSYNIPVTQKDMLRALSTVPEEDLEGLCKVVITHPRRNKEFGFFGRYDLYGSIIYLFAQLQKDKSYLVGQWCAEMSPSDLRNKILKGVLLHEVGHHVGSKCMDLSEDFANNYVKKIMEKLD